MTLAPGSRLGVYEVIAPLGAGGMGEVYRARDSKLQREVAIKVLIATVANEPDRLARFSREAQVLASLSHPNIAAIYGLEDGAIVMELVEGPTLADRLAGGPLPIDESVAIARQITDALSAAHDAGVIHRDLKPANIKVRPDGTVKVLDFGLAKALEPAGADVNVANSPTLSIHATQQGMILGTAAYMAPEQARGRAVDRRADIWAFGAVLYEMLTGRRAFDGDDVSITLASVLKDDVKWQALPADVPQSVRRLLRRCLEKDPRRRLSAIADARLELDDAAAPGEGERVNPPSAGARLPWAVALVMTLAAAVVTALWQPWRPRVEEPRTVFELQPPANSEGWGAHLAVSPDGRQFITRAGTPGNIQLWLRPLNRAGGAEMPGTESAIFPFWAPDSLNIGFFADRKLKRLDIRDGSSAPVADAPDGRGGSWNREGVMVFAPTSNGPLFRVAVNGGAPVAISEIDKSRGEFSHRFPVFLPDGKHFVYLAMSLQAEHAGIYLLSLDASEPTLLVKTPVRAEFVEPDLLVFVREGRLMAQRLDLSRRQLTGDAFQLAEGVRANPAAGTLWASITRTVLAYTAGGEEPLLRRLMRVESDGKPGSPIGEPGVYQSPRMSPDGTRLALFAADAGSGDIWIRDLERGTNTRFTFDPAMDNVPVWSPDGTRLAFVSNRDGGVFNIYQKSAGGAGDDQLLLKTANHKTITDWSRDGRFLLYQENDPATGADLWALPLFGDKKPIRILATPYAEGAAAFSPDGRWFAYQSNESGTYQVYVQTFPPSGAKWQISTVRGNSPVWRPDGRQLFYDQTGRLLAVDLLELTTERFKASVPKPLFSGLIDGAHNYDVAADGRRFIIVTDANATPGAPLAVIMTVNWMSEAK